MKTDLILMGNRDLAEKLTVVAADYPEIVDLMREAASRIIDLDEQVEEYEVLGEQGLLLKLPCKIDDDVYCFWTVYDFHADEIETNIIKEKFEVAMIEEIGKTVFLTKAEAEKKLAEMEK